MWSMSVGQTIGRLCQPVQDVLGGLHTLERHLNFPSDICKRNQSLLYTIRLVPKESGWPTHSGNNHFLSLERPFRCQDQVFFWCSMCEWAGTVLGKCSHPELNPKSSQHCPDKEQWYLAPGLKSGLLDETHSILWGEMNCRGRYKPLLQYLSRRVIGGPPTGCP